MITNTKTQQVEFSEDQDRWLWNLVGEGSFSVASTRSFIEEGLCLLDGSPTRWVKLVPIKVNILAWRIALNKIPSRFNMSLRGLDVPSIVCPVFQVGIETTNHFFFSCSVASAIVTRILVWWELPANGFSTYQEWLSCYIEIQKDIPLNDSDNLNAFEDMQQPNFHE
ncbi:reverse transcriptase domain, Reverse transcriptase zinc-binding domain protein [Artemisia annua]|uniref:Reverse transcriptase domain, Reverse transcriptase zinc-binding domain protein n=1 Tax=Artemisia annua TaxID=35608 RepID=A0A2U1PE72_ARTAN|nr:reverse transcriptase domain, Reverse transcriptase zinc-binding domain protein [Artemisia annua]